MQLASSITEATPQQFWMIFTIIILIALLCFYFTFRLLYRYRLIADTATSKIRSAAQGYTELEGIVEFMAGEPVQAPLSGCLCPWFSYKVEKRTTHYIKGRRHSQWDTIEQGVSNAIFQLRDSTGICIVDPEGASVTPSVSSTWYGNSRRPVSPPQQSSFADSLFRGDNYRYSESIIQTGDYLYALGNFSSADGYSGHQSSQAEVRERLNQWKNNQSKLLQRFDADKNSVIDMQEWQNARSQAEKEVAASRREQSLQPQYHVLQKPLHRKQPFILSTKPQHKIISHYRIYAGLSAVVFLALGCLASWALSVRS